MAKLMTKRDINLLRESKIIKEYHVLQNFIAKTPNWDDRRLKELDKETIIFFNDIYPKVLKEVTKEWNFDENTVEYKLEGTIKCELCGQGNVKKSCIIENVFTQQKMRIGTECVQHFGIDRDIDIERLVEDRKRISNLERLNTVYPGIENKIYRWDTFLNKQPILVKGDIAKTHIELGNKAKNIFEKYISVKTTEKKRGKLIIEMNDLLLKNEQEKQKIEEYVMYNKNKDLIPDRNLINRLKTSDKHNVVKILKEDGKIRHKTLFRIQDKEFSKTLINKYNKQLEEFNCKIDEVVEEPNLGYQITYKKKNRIKLFCTHEKLCMNYYNFITGDKGDDISFKGIVEISKIYGNRSIENALYELFDLIVNTKFELKEHIYNQPSIYCDYNELYVYDKKDKLYFMLKINLLINKFKEDIFMGEKLIDQKFYKYIYDSCKKPISREDMKIKIKDRDYL